MQRVQLPCEEFAVGSRQNHIYQLARWHIAFARLVRAKRKPTKLPKTFGSRTGRRDSTFGKYPVTISVSTPLCRYCGSRRRLFQRPKSIDSEHELLKTMD